MDPADHGKRQKVPDFMNTIRNIQLLAVAPRIVSASSLLAQVQPEQNSSGQDQARIRVASSMLEEVIVTSSRIPPVAAALVAFKRSEPRSRPMTTISSTVAEAAMAGTCQAALVMAMARASAFGARGMLRPLVVAIIGFSIGFSCQ